MDPQFTFYAARARSPYDTAISSMKLLADGAPVCVHQKTLVGINNGYLFIEEVDRSSGIKVLPDSHYPPVELQPGNLISFSGTMGTSDGERVIHVTSDFDCDFAAVSQISPLGMSSPAIQGWPADFRFPEGPRKKGLLPVGLLVQVWGKVVAKELADEEGMWYVYLDDGWHLKDGTYPGFTGLRVYSDRIPAPGEDFQVAAGVCATKTYDPTPLGPSGDEFLINVIRTTGENDLHPPTSPGPTRTYSAISGSVRLVGQAAPGKDVRIYSERSSVIVKNVTDQWTPYTLESVADDGGKVSASAAGYVSVTRDTTGGANQVDLELALSPRHLEIAADKSTLRICSSDKALISVMLRDCEGKGIPEHQIKMTTTSGQFVESGAAELLLTTDAVGLATAYLSAGGDGEGLASVRAEEYPENSCSAQLAIAFRGPDLTVSASQTLLAQAGTSLITAHLVDSGQVLANAPVTFSTDHGVFQQSGTPIYTGLTNANGDAQASLVLSAPGTARVLVVFTNSCSQQTIAWVAVSYMSQPWYAQGVMSSNPLVVDLDGAPDGKKEVVVVTSAGNLSALSASGELMWSKTMHPPGSNTPSCAVIDNDRSGRPCIFVPAENQQKVQAYSYSGNPIAGWPVGSNYRFIKVSAAIGDLNLDGTPEIVAGDECCYVFSWNPTGDWKATGTADSSFLWKNLTGTPSTAIYGSSCAIGDMDGDAVGMPDVCVGTNRAPEAYGFPGDAWGDFVSSPYYLDGWPKNTHGRVESSPALGDVDGDGRNDVVMGSDDGNVYVHFSADDSWVGFPTGGQIESSPALCDLDGDGKLDIIVGSDSGSVFAFNWLGQSPEGWAGGIRLNSQGDYQVISSPVVGDVDGDGQVEVVVGCNDGNVYALYKDGASHRVGGSLTGPIAWVRCCVPPGQTGSQILTAPVIDDLDNDGLVEVVVASEKGIYVFHMDAPYAQDPVRFPWPTFHRDNARTGCVGPAPAPVYGSIHGIVTRSGAPISQAKVYIYYNDGSPVPVPHSDPPYARDYVLTVGTSDPTEVGKGAYCINQLPANRTYKLKIVVTGELDHWVNDIAVTTGARQVDIDLAQ